MREDRARGFAISSAPVALASGTRFGSYEVTSKLGEGGMGEVYRARDAKLNRDVAVKVLPDLFAADPERLARFEREAQVLASLNHPNIAQIYGMEVVGDQTASGAPLAARALVMELVPGRTLEEVIQSAPGHRLPLAEAIAIARQLADALEAAHDQGIVHRDLKPANIKVRDDGTVKVLDFGLAKIWTPDSAQKSDDLANSPTLTGRATQLGMIIGTAAYMAPEQARGRAVDRRADIWAFGLVLFEMLSGRRAFEGDDVSIMLASVLKDEVPWAALPSDIPPRVRRVLRRCLEKDPRRRLSAIGDARFDLEDDEPHEAATKTVATPARASTTWLLIAGAAVAGVLVATAGLWPWLHPAPATSLRRLSVIAPESDALFPDGGESAISPDGMSVAFVTGTSASMGATQLWVRRLDASRSTPVAGATGAHLPFWSPDSRQIGFFANGKLNTVAVDGGRIDVLCDAPDGRGGTWSPRGVIVFAPSNGGALQRISVDGGTPAPVLTLDAAQKETGQRFPSFLPDGTHFLFASIPSKNGVYDIFAAGLDEPGRTKVAQSESGAQYVEPGYLVFMRKSAIAVQPFDAKTRTVTGDVTAFPDTPGNTGTWYLATPPASAAPGAMVFQNDPFADTRLAWIDQSGRETGSVQAPAGHYTELELSPDGQRVALIKQSTAKDSTIWTLDMVRHGATRVADAPHFNYYVAWSPDSARIAFANDGAGWENLFVRDAMAATPIQSLYSSADTFKKPMSWSPDGKWLLYNERHPNTQDDLFVVPTSGDAKPTPYVNDTVDENWGRISPDGHWVVYVSDESGSNEVYLRSFPTPNEKHRVTTDGGTAARWKRDGSALLIVGTDGQQLKIADVRLSPALTIGAPRIVGAIPRGILAWDAAPDLEHLLVAIPAGNAQLSLTVITNWLSAVKKR